MCSVTLLFACTGPAAVSTSSEGPTGDRVGDGAEHDLPYEKWGKCLQVLNLNNNKLLWLPDYIGSLHSLTKLDLSKYNVWAAAPVEVSQFMLLINNPHARARTHMHTRARTHAYTHACIHACTRAHTRMHTCTHTHAHTRTHTHAHTRTHTHAHTRTRYSVQDVQYTSSITVSLLVFSHVFIVLP